MTLYSGFVGNAVSSSLDLLSWGMNSDGQLADASTTDRGPVVVTSLLGIAFIDYAVGSTHSCGIEDTGTGEVYCVGNND
jgi:alpha-tubulin suppressor-like RCC1 family protein